MNGYSNTSCSPEDLSLIWCFVSSCNSGDQLEVSYESVQRIPYLPYGRTWKCAQVSAIVVAFGNTLCPASQEY